MTASVSPDMVDDFLRLVDLRAVDDAGAMVLRELEAGHRPEDIIVSLLAAVQTEVGDRWHQARWTIAHEHQATAMADAALHRLHSAVRPRTYRGTVAVVCAEGDWHTLPSRMAAELLRLDGWGVTFLGASLPVQDLAHWLSETRPDGLVVSCSMPIFAHGARNMAMAAARQGVPVVSGGHGLGPDGRRAAALHVGWAPNLADLHPALADPIGTDYPAGLQDRLAANDAFTGRRNEVRAVAMHALSSSGRAEDPSSWQRTRAVTDVTLIIDFLAATVLVDDPRVFTEFLDWLITHLQARGTPAASVVRSALHALKQAVPPEFTAAHQHLDSADGAVSYSSGVPDDSN